MYTNVDFKTKKAFKEAVAKGDRVTLYAPGLGTPARGGTETVEGSHYPKPHTWYARVVMKGGVVVSVR